MTQLSRLYLFLSLLMSIVPVLGMNDFPLYDDPAIISMLNSTHFEATTRQSTPFDIVSILDDVGIISLLQENLYNKSYPLNKRYILDLPLFTFPWYHSRCKEAGYQFFYNQMSKMTFAQECNKITSYLNIAGSWRKKRSLVC